jgi:hypothetical protein
MLNVRKICTCAMENDLEESADGGYDPTAKAPVSRAAESHEGQDQDDER